MTKKNSPYSILASDVDAAKIVIKQNVWKGKAYAKTTFAHQTLSDLINLSYLSYANVSGQQYGPKLQRWMELYANWDRVPQTDDRGDSKTTSGKFVEQKWSMSSDKAAHGVQCRLWQNNDGYIFGMVDVEDTDNFKVEIFYLTGDEMKAEVALMNRGASHGTKLVNQSQTHIEITMSVVKDSPDHIRWRTKYLKPLSFFLTL
jgi:hypothetical protein